MRGEGDLARALFVWTMALVVQGSMLNMCHTNGMDVTAPSGVIDIEMTANTTQPVCVWNMRPITGLGMYFTFKSIRLGDGVHACLDSNITLIDWTQYKETRICPADGAALIGNPVYIAGSDIDLIYRRRPATHSHGFSLQFQAVSCPALSLARGVGIEVDDRKVTLTCRDGSIQIFYCRQARWEPPPPTTVCHVAAVSATLVGVLAGVGCITVLLLVAVLGFCCCVRRSEWCKRRRKDKDHQQQQHHQSKHSDATLDITRYTEIQGNTANLEIEANIVNEVCTRAVRQPPKRSSFYGEKQILNIIRDRKPLLVGNEYSVPDASPKIHPNDYCAMPPLRVQLPEWEDTGQSCNYNPKNYQMPLERPSGHKSNVSSMSSPTSGSETWSSDDVDDVVLPVVNPSLRSYVSRENMDGNTGCFCLAFKPRRRRNSAESDNDNNYNRGEPHEHDLMGMENETAMGGFPDTGVDMSATRKSQQRPIKLPNTPFTLEDDNNSPVVRVGPTYFHTIPLPTPNSMRKKCDPPRTLPLNTLPPRPLYLHSPHNRSPCTCASNCKYHPGMSRDVGCQIEVGPIRADPHSTSPITGHHRRPHEFATLSAAHLGAKHNSAENVLEILRPMECRTDGMFVVDSLRRSNRWQRNNNRSTTLAHVPRIKSRLGDKRTAQLSNRASYDPPRTPQPSSPRGQIKCCRHSHPREHTADHNYIYAVPRKSNEIPQKRLTKKTIYPVKVIPPVPPKRFTERSASCTERGTYSMNKDLKNRTAFSQSTHNTPTTPHRSMIQTPDPSSIESHCLVEEYLEPPYSQRNNNSHVPSEITTVADVHSPDTIFVANPSPVFSDIPRYDAIQLPIGLLCRSCPDITSTRIYL